MSEVPKITREEAAILEAECFLKRDYDSILRMHEAGLVSGWSTHIGNAQQVDVTDLGRAALAAYEEEREREIRRKAIDRCREWLRERMSEAECANNLIYADCIEDLIARFDSEVTP